MIICHAYHTDPVLTPISHLYDVIKPLGPDELHRLNNQLGLSKQDVEKAEASVSSRDSTRKAEAVIRYWKKRNGKKATVDALRQATERCRNTQAKETSKGKSCQGVTTGCTLPISYIVYCYLEFKFRYPKMVKLFSIRVKELFQPILLRRKGDFFFFKRFS